MKKIKVLKTILLISLLSIILIISCKKKEEASISNNSMYVSSPDNIYHKTYTNVVKIQGKFVNMNSSLSYANREE
ncbi:putative ankyrin repeat-containing protein [Brachyspira murdochii DSM 12563]|uniref:Putative ankyrin repeat-containing protein n=1 Tax=Brachyspira murdochii (strain ATCC 51284 / DSM 12563 / 56-150) TaxID=526224 RepID=D5U3H7_BRAM5|nr:putative ankyrin repeat-containing protein [Brachyspira murdochii DSM 12563]